ncbi:MAG: hypothetical protein ACREAZ_02965 [Nitrososphaera sp.]
MSLSIQHHTTARYLFITLTFAGLLSTGWFGIPLIPKYFINNSMDLVAGIYTLFSALGSIWGIMAYREFTKSLEMIIEARVAARKLDPMIGDYEYRSYNPITREYEDGFAPSGPIDFWDKETQVPHWMDKGKYWHVLMILKGGNREVRLKVVKDEDLPFYSSPMNVAVTTKERTNSESATRSFRFSVKVPQWLVMNTERSRFASHDLGQSELSALISDLNRKIVDASAEVAGWETLRIRYPLNAMTLLIYLNKSLPLRIVYHQVIRKFRGAKELRLEETNYNLADIKDDELVSSVLELASNKGISTGRLEMLRILILFLKNAYSRLGLGEGASEYHSFHHSLEVSYMALHMLPRQLKLFTFGPKDYEVILVAALLHDFDPSQETRLSSKEIRKGPAVVRTMEELKRTRIVDAYFSMSRNDFENYFREYSSNQTPPVEFAATHPEQVNQEWTPLESAMVEALIWRTDFPFREQKLAQERFALAIMQLTGRGQDGDRISTIAEILWLADLAVTYMGSDRLRAWDRVTNLYEELNLPKLEAVTKTDKFFSVFAKNPNFNQIIRMKYFPSIFKQRWKLVHRFFHEGNPSTQLVDTIDAARKLYSRVNLEIGMRRGEMLRRMASECWSEYFIAIGRDQNEVFKAKSTFSELDPQNALAFWGDSERLLSDIPNRSIDNFLLVLPEHSVPLSTSDGMASFRSMFADLSKRLVRGGAIRIMTDLDKDSQAFRKLVSIAAEAGLQPVDSAGKSYFPNDWRDPEFRTGSNPQIIILVPKS